MQCMRFHGFPMGEHAGQGSFDADCLVVVGIEGPHFRLWTAQLTAAEWGISVIEGGEFQ